jgi:hypothetical protein
VDIPPLEPGRSTEPSRRAPGRGALITATSYAVLLVLGIAEGVIGSFQYSRGIGAFPAAAIGFALLILFTCVLAASGMQAPSAALMPAVGWFVASFVLAMSTPGGSIVITNTAAGKWYLFGGAAAAAAGVIAGFTRWSATRVQRQGALGQPAPRQNVLGQFAARQNARRPRKPGQ